MINKEEVKHIAELARLGLNEEEIKTMEKELSSILDYMETLKKVDAEDSAITNYSKLIENTMREDKIKTTENNAQLMGAVPEMEKGFIKVKTVL
ncbi:Asp-tRNA(Asn)/Glu-tRNA(Gln) amidotransferase subunit GatC [Candidatus Parcubacteria bacterium]|nr:Asp-tRNA(Asn)/Glu-tRNA(Gln) amidotransferase subunit GatC [Candidatus Parcubacteria bacterium]